MSLKSRVHVPTVRKLTVPPEIEHTEEDEASTVMMTVSPEVAVAVGVYVAPPTTALAGAVEVMVMVLAA
jgi:hypothetical protein